MSRVHYCQQQVERSYYQWSKDYWRGQLEEAKHEEAHERGFHLCHMCDAECACENADNEGQHCDHCKGV